MKISQLLLHQKHSLLLLEQKWISLNLQSVLNSYLEIQMLTVNVVVVKALVSLVFFFISFLFLFWLHLFVLFFIRPFLSHLLLGLKREMES